MTTPSTETNEAAIEELTELLDRIKQETTTIGLPQWGEDIANWLGQVDNGAQWRPATWYVTDLRHLHNLQFAYNYQDWVNNDQRYDQVNEVADSIQELYELVFGVDPYD